MQQYRAEFSDGSFAQGSGGDRPLTHGYMFKATKPVMSGGGCSGLAASEAEAKAELAYWIKNNQKRGFTVESSEIVPATPCADVPAFQHF